MILKNYLIRTAKDPLNFLMLILFPFVMYAIFVATARGTVPFELRSLDGFCLQATGMLAFNVLFFQYFGGMLVTDFLYSDFRTDMRWRFMATPRPLSSFILSAVGASIIIGAINGAIVLTVARFVFDAYFNIPVAILSLLGMSIFVTLFGILCFQIFPKKSTTTAVIMVFAFAQMLAINFGMIQFPELGEIGIANFLPLAAASLAMDYASGFIATFNNPELGFEGGVTMWGVDMNMAFTNLGILAGIIVVALIAVILVGRKRKI